MKMLFENNSHLRVNVLAKLKTQNHIVNIIRCHKQPLYLLCHSHCPGSTALPRIAYAAVIEAQSYFRP